MGRSTCWRSSQMQMQMMMQMAGRCISAPPAQAQQHSEKKKQQQPKGGGAGGAGGGASHGVSGLVERVAGEQPPLPFGDFAKDVIGGEWAAMVETSGEVFKNWKPNPRWVDQKKREAAIKNFKRPPGFPGEKELIQKRIDARLAAKGWSRGARKNGEAYKGHAAKHGKLASAYSNLSLVRASSPNSKTFERGERGPFRLQHGQRRRGGRGRWDWWRRSCRW